MRPNHKNETVDFKYIKDEIHYRDITRNLSVKIFFLASDNPHASGGLKFIYRYCEMANELGYDAAVMHGKPGFGVDNFTHNAPIVFNYSWKKPSRRKAAFQTIHQASERLLSKNREVVVNSGDIIIVPENRLFRVHEIFPDTQKIVFNQNPFLAARQGVPRKNVDIIGTLNTSDICLAMSRRLLPEKPAFVVPYWLEREVFKPEKTKKHQIAYMPRRNAEDASMVFNLLAASGATADIKIVPISNMTLDQVAQTLRESLMFFSFADREGFGLPGAEAIASGCLTIGYTGIGGDEFFTRFGGWPIAQQDILTFADTAASILDSYERDPEPLDSLRMKNADAISDHYSKPTAQTAFEAALASMLTKQGN